MSKLDLKKDLKQLYAPSAKIPVLVEVPPLNYLMIDGHGDPNVAPAYVAAVEALYALAYALKFKIKKSAGGVDYTVMPLEGLWWVDDMRQFSVQDKASWQWTMLILQPQFVTASLVAELQVEAARKKSLPALAQVRLETYLEGQSAQILHHGPYAAEEPTITQLHAFIAQHGYLLRGKHHEIYLSDPRKTAPDRLRTIIRQPVSNL